VSISNILTIGGAVALAGLVTFAGVEHGQAVKYRRLDADHRACLAALQPHNIIDPARLCDPAIANDHAAAVKAKACDEGLDAVPENTFGLRQVCSTAVKGLVAERDVARAERDGFQGDLKVARDGQAAAITRAEARIRTEAQRKIDAAQVVASAPRDADGLVVCDAGCLRRRAGQTP
jgi:hypothetical protein